MSTPVQEKCRHTVANSNHFFTYSTYTLCIRVCINTHTHICICMYTLPQTQNTALHDDSVRLEVKRSCTVFERMTEMNGDSKAQMHVPVRHLQDTENQSYKYRLEIYRSHWYNRLRELFQHLGMLRRVIFKSITKGIYSESEKAANVND